MPIVLPATRAPSGPEMHPPLGGKKPVYVLVNFEGNRLDSLPRPVGERASGVVVDISKNKIYGTLAYPLTMGNIMKLCPDKMTIVKPINDNKVGIRTKEWVPSHPQYHLEAEANILKANIVNKAHRSYSLELEACEFLGLPLLN